MFFWQDQDLDFIKVFFSYSVNIDLQTTFLAPNISYSALNEFYEPSHDFNLILCPLIFFFLTLDVLEFLQNEQSFGFIQVAYAQSICSLVKCYYTCFGFVCSLGRDYKLLLNIEHDSFQ